MEINQEKKDIIKIKGNVLVIANPGTGKTFLLVNKYLSLLKEGLNPKDILCLTFTNKAKKEMENRLLKMMKEERFDYSNMNVYTFHSYALDYLEGSKIISSNLLRYTIYDYLKQNKILSYGEKYLLETVVPKIENLIRYLKSFGITPDNINLEEAKKHLVFDKKISKDELERFTDEFIKIFKIYEETKSVGENDYNDLLINFLKMSNPPKFKYVLIDELQDVNDMEAEIALMSGENFIAVGDQKQAIFGFQGGSILNFKKFQNSTTAILSENFRSTNEILDYAGEYFISKTKEKAYQKALRGFKNREAIKGKKPRIYSVPYEQIISASCTIADNISKEGKKVAIIARTNRQIMDISKELSDRGLKHTSTYFSASAEAKENIINFLKSIFSNEIDDIKTAMFTPFFPINLKDAFELVGTRDLNIEQVYKKSVGFKELKDSIENLEDINILFKKNIVPIAISYGEEYLLAAMTLQEACQQALTLLEDKSLPKVIAYLKSSDLLSGESEVEKGIILTTVHKAKGKEFENVIYVPKKTSDNSNFQDRTVEGILGSKKINVNEELEEEILRINFVAFTRAEKNLMIITDKPNEYLNDYSELAEETFNIIERSKLSESNKRAYALFINKEYAEAKEVLETKNVWIKRFVKEHFDNLDRISFSKLTLDAYEYFNKSILELWEKSPSMDLGSKVHDVAEAILNGEEYEVDKETKPYIENVKKLIAEIKTRFPEKICAEESISVPISKLVDTKEEILFKGLIDAIFKGGERYLIVDWKTNWSDEYASGHRQQLAVYKKLVSISQGIDIDKIWIAIGYVGLKRKVHDGTIRHQLDNVQPASSAFNTVMKRVNLLLSWKQNIDKFFQDLKNSKGDDSLKRSIVEQYEKELKQEGKQEQKQKN